MNAIEKYRCPLAAGQNQGAVATMENRIILIEGDEEIEILYLLAAHPGRAFSKERLYELIWKEPYFGNENVLNTHINRLRLKLKSNAEDTTTYIKILWGIGYKMEDN